MRIVLDTNVLVSYLLDPDGDLAAIVDQILTQHLPLQSDATLFELRDVLDRPKIRRYVDAAKAMAFIAQLDEFAERVDITATIVACRDPKDDKFLSLAVSGHADCIVSGDADLLVLHPFRGIPILTAGAFKRQHGDLR